MSSAVQQPLSSTPLTTASNRYSSPSDNAPSATASPSTRRPPSRKTSGPGMTQSPHQSPQTDRSAMPPVAPPRTSSNQQRSRYHSTERVRQNGDNGRSSSKRAPNAYSPQDVPGRTSESRDRGSTQMPIRTAPAPSKPTREANENLNKVINQVEEPQDAAQADLSPRNDEQRGGRSRHDYNNRGKSTTKFGDFILGNTIGEGEFGKVKLGWKQDSNVQVAIKLIKRDTVGGNPSRLAKIRREVTILRELQHPNIVQLIDMVETDRYIGIILEYASGGELFDYILNHRYLKDQSARRLFAQLVSGVGYLHKKGIVHRDLKLENLLLDRNRNIIITDFGFANTFNPNEDLLEEEEQGLTDREFVKRIGLDKVKSNGMRKGDLMQTSCGSPCYAAPELVVSDCLYTGRKVDVWSCGVILYAMLAGYLPFDDDPANPEGDNINLLYKYIVSTPLTFPEYVTPHARDLLRRILVPNPRKRADLFEVARHSWLSEYAHVVEFITSSTTLPGDVQKTIKSPEESADQPLGRSNSVRDAHKQKAQSPTHGGLSKTHGKIDGEAEAAQKTPKDAKRRTVQVEYVAPVTATQRGTDSSASRSQSASRGDHTSSKDKPLPRDPPVSRDGRDARPVSSRRPQSSQRQPRGPREPQRAAAENAYIPSSATTGARPQTGNSMSSAASMGLQSMAHYGQLAPPTVADTNAEGRMAQPMDNEEPVGRPSVSVPPKFARVSGMNEQPQRGHKRSSTLGEIGGKLLGRTGSVFGGKSKKRPEQVEKSRKYPPVSMQHPMPNDEPGRPSMESRQSRRSFSQTLGLGKKQSGSMSGSQGSGEKSDRRRFSFLPASFSLKSVGIGKDAPGTPPSEYGSQHNLPIQDSRDPPRSFTAHGDARGSSPIFGPEYNNRPAPTSHPARHQRYASAQLDNRRPNAVPPHMQPLGTHYNAGSDSSVDMRRPPTEPQMRTQPRHGYSNSEAQRTGTPGTPGSNRVLHKNDKTFTGAYDHDDRGHKGSSGKANRVMDFFRRRGKARGGEEHA